jgi:PST family polysaccharide transporter
VNPYFDEAKALEGLGRRALRGGATMITARVATSLIQVGSVLFLARLLTPEDYGLVAMVAALTGFAPIFVDLGTRDAMVQRAGLSEAEASALFWLTIGAGCACALLVAVSGPLLAAFYGEPRLTSIVRVSSLTFVVFAITAQHQALLRRAVRFRELAILDIAANLVSVTGAVALAYGGFGYWALVTRPISMYCLAALGTFWYCRWMPGKPVWTEGVRAMVKFGLNLCGFTMTDFVARNSDRVAVGWGLGARTLGFYQNALFVYDNVLDILVFPLHQVAVSGLSRLRDDVDALRRAWAKTLSSVTFFVMPAFGVLAITGPDLVVLLLGDKWTTAGALLSVLALRGIAHSAERTLGWLHVAAGRTDRWLRWGIAATCVQLLGLLCGLPFGPFGIAWANVASMFVLFVPALVYSGRPFGIGVRDVISVIGPQWVSALTAAGAGFAVRRWVLSGAEPVERTLVLTAVYVAIYGLLVVGCFRVTTPLRVGLALVNDLLVPGWARRPTRGDAPRLEPAGPPDTASPK